MSSSSQAPESWISAFCSIVGHEYFAEVSEDFIEDDFNLTGLASQVPMYKEALEMILDVEPEEVSDEDEEEEDDISENSDASMRDSQHAAYRRADARRHVRMQSDVSIIETSAEMLYGLIHQRFITSRPGIQQMFEKYEMGHFGTCPRVNCRGAKVLPVGCSDIPQHETVKLFCPACLDVYAPPNSRFQNVDGAFFGTTFGCLFFMTFPELEVGGTKPPPTENGIAASHSSSSLGGPSNLASPPEKSSRTSLSPPSSTAHNSTTQPPSESEKPKMINGISSPNLAPGLGPGNIYEPRIYGFRVSELAKTGPRMKWLRMRPTDMNELDEVAVWERVQAHAARRAAAAAAAAAGTPAAGQEVDIEGDVEEDMDAQDEEEGEEVLLEEEEEDVEDGQGVQMQVPDGEELESASKKRKGRRRQESLVNGDGGAAVGNGG